MSDMSEYFTVSRTYYLAVSRTPTIACGRFDKYSWTTGAYKEASAQVVDANRASKVEK